MKISMKLTAVALAASLLAGCAGPNKQGDSNYLLCSLAGGLVGGGLAAAAGDSSEAAFGGAVVGAGLSLLLCPSEEEAAPAVVAEPVEAAPLDSDSDGVFDDQDMCPNTPAGVQVDSVGCPLDTDKDGVADYKDMCPGTPLGTVVDEAGCPLKGEKILSLTGVNFAFDKAVLTPNAETVLEEAVTLLKNSDSVIEVRVEGHTDSVGAEAYNQKLSQERAEAVVAYLVSRGVKERSLKAVGMGETSPVADNTTADGRAENRRVDFVVE
ncbi:MAG TPA: OmpA family protein [Methylophaga sp.]|nr:OmpA family protein [Methylophaga sp.]